MKCTRVADHAFSDGRATWPQPRDFGRSSRRSSMKLRLRTLFVITAVFACLSMWIATRQTMRYPAVLVQAVYPLAPTGANAVTSVELEDAFYAALSKKIANNSSSPSALGKHMDVRNQIRFENITKDNKSSLIMVSAWGNPLLSNDDQIKGNRSRV